MRYVAVLVVAVAVVLVSDHVGLAAGAAVAVVCVAAALLIDRRGRKASTSVRS